MAKRRRKKSSFFSTGSKRRKRKKTSVFQSDTKQRTSASHETTPYNDESAGCVLFFLAFIVLSVMAVEGAKHIGWIAVLGILAGVLAIVIICLCLTRSDRRISKVRELLDGGNANLAFNFDGMTGTEFEAACAKVLQVNGYRNIQLTKTSGDYGIDILCEMAGRRYAIQCKRYSRNVGVAALQQVESGCRYYGYDVPAVMTNMYFTQPAQNLASSNGILLFDRDAMMTMLRTKNRGKSKGEAIEIAGAYERLFRDVYKAKVSIPYFKTEFERLHIEYSLQGDTNEIRQILDELDGEIGYHHELDASGTTLVITRSNGNS